LADFNAEFKNFALMRERSQTVREFKKRLFLSFRPKGEISYTGHKRGQGIPFLRSE